MKRTFLAIFSYFFLSQVFVSQFFYYVDADTPPEVNDSPIFQTGSPFEDSTVAEGTNSVACSQSSIEKPAPKLYNQSDLSNLIRKLGLSQSHSEILASDLFNRNMLAPDTRVTYYRKRNEELLPFFKWANNERLCVASY